MRRILNQLRNQIRKYFLPIITAGLALLLVLSWLFPNRVLDTYEMNISASKEEERVIPLPEGSVLSYTLNTGNRPLRGIQPGVSLQGFRFAAGQLRCRVYREPSHELVSDNVYPLSELTAGMQANLDSGMDASLSLESMYTYIPFADYEKCKGDIAIEFSYESMGEVPEAFLGVAAPAEEGAAPGEAAMRKSAVPALLVNSVQKENTETRYNGENVDGGLCGYSIYTHNTYPLVYDLRLLICIFLAASVAAQGCGAVLRRKKIRTGREERTPDDAGVRKSADSDMASKKADAKAWMMTHAKKAAPVFTSIIAAVFVAFLIETLVFNGHAIFQEAYVLPLSDIQGAATDMVAESGRQKLTAEEENAVLRNRENARILAELNGIEYIPPQEEGITEEEDGLYRSVKRTRIETGFAAERYIHTLRLTLPQTEDGNEISVWADGEKVVSSAWLDERIRTGSYILDRKCSELTVEIIGREELMTDKAGKAAGENDAAGQNGVQLTAVNDFTFHPVRFMFMISAFGLALLFVRGRKLFAEKPEAVFALCSLVLGSVLIYAVGLNQIGYDEHIHMKAAYNRSFGTTVLTTESAMQMEASTMPAFGNLEERRLVEAYAETNNDFGWANITHQSRFPNYDVRSYLQISIFMWLGRVLKLPFVWCMMLGKFGNLLLYTVVCYFAIKCAKQGKVLVAAIALIPNCIFAAASFSYDAVVNSFLLLAMVLTLNQMMDKQRINRIQTLVLLGAFLAGSTAKAIYIFMAFLLLLFPKEKFGSRWRALTYKLCVTALMILLIYTFFFPPVSASSNFEVMGNLAYAGDKRSQGTSVLGQISWILGNPFAYAKLLFGSMLGELWNYVRGAKPFIAYGYLGGMPVIWTWLGLAALVFASAFSPKEESRAAIPHRFKIGNALVVLGVGAVIWTSMYVTFTAVGADVINGVQGRYFLPLFLPFFSCFYREKGRLEISSELYAKIVFAVYVLMNLYGTWTLGRIK